jgi:CheY-like chemotaxis protein
MLHGFRVLAVDEDISTVLFYASTLKSHHADFRVATTGQDALGHVRPTWVPHVVLVSEQLRDMHVRELIAEVKRHAGDAVGLVCTVRDEGGAARAKAGGFDACLVKPVAIDTLVQAVGKAAKAARLHPGT